MTESEKKVVTIRLNIVRAEALKMAMGIAFELIKKHPGWESRLDHVPEEIMAEIERAIAEARQ